MSTSRLVRERRTVEAMIRLWCRHRHVPATYPTGAPVSRPPDLCPACADLLAYATARLAHCRFGAAKPTCARCPIHCYRADRRDEIRAVMRWAGPRMVWRHPWLAFMHLVDGAKPARPAAHRQTASSSPRADA